MCVLLGLIFSCIETSREVDDDRNFVFADRVIT